MFGWLGNVFTVVGLWKVGNRTRQAFLWAFAGECCYAVHLAARRDWAMLTACLLFLTLATRSYIKWGKPTTEAK
jgi:hypothetical protein